ncbi:hypothetical protein HAX54_051948 [Datura stramonium]|uniref:Retrotransposon gag domain-containing protein n=1 Tax=Datura stramonium TaxID=4076 RepID=A0ABS8WN33_DATST|nr:hypothetical protein [Datura stramonium]
MEQEIDGIKEMIAYLMKMSNKNSEGHFPIRKTAYSNHGSSAHHFQDMHSLSLKEAFNSLTEACFTIEEDLIEMENENENLLNIIDFPMYDGMGNSRIHLKAYLDSLAGMEQGNKLKMRLFVRTLTGPALMWYAKQGMGMLGHTTDQCHSLKDEIQKLLNNGRVIQRSMARP